MNILAKVYCIRAVNTYALLTSGIWTFAVAPKYDFLAFRAMIPFVKNDGRDGLVLLQDLSGRFAASRKQNLIEARASKAPETETNEAEAQQVGIFCNSCRYKFFRIDKSLEVAEAMFLLNEGSLEHRKLEYSDVVAVALDIKKPN